MSESSLSALEQAAAKPLPSSGKLAGRFPLYAHPSPSSDQEVAQVLKKLQFGTAFGDFMSAATYTEDEGWHRQGTIPYGPLSLDPAAAVLHYSQEIFEGLKAYRHADNSIWAFRPNYNAARFQASARRLVMPEMPTELFVASLIDVVRADTRWVPDLKGSALYLRPFMFASEGFLGVRPAVEYTYLCITSPVGPYFKSGFQPVSIWVTKQYHRAMPGGTGAAKTGGNYAAGLIAQQDAKERGFQQVCFLDSVQGEFLEELGGMNVFAVSKDGSVRTPRLTGTILEGGTRLSIIQLLRDQGREVIETDISINQLVSDIKSGEVVEMFVCGTAAVVTPIGHLAGENFDVTLDNSALTEQVYDHLTGIQYGTIEDTHNWMYRLA
ncbi:branched-chain amino acid aminotransferase [Boudabousia marimammalium]|uniref:branched-chain-amino-acid transaminase n=1 Tax=Boudabousia marimammalium TaxID=156892 RepID=A0A1Q5PPA3_9ACTO|nr:branched-chain amino acid aminotransferase [Boudabousia marimammalium]OKL49367.1 branched chain amino acid aminotransferase [Boudabousia marimammalium]